MFSSVEKALDAKISILFYTAKELAGRFVDTALEIREQKYHR